MASAGAYFPVGSRGKAPGHGVSRELFAFPKPNLSRICAFSELL